MNAVESLHKSFTGKTGVRLEPWPLFILGFILLANAFIWMPAVVSLALSMSLFLAPLWLPLLIVGGAWKMWYVLKRSEFIAEQKYVLLEIKSPRNLVKTPLAMEAFFSAIHLTGGESTWYQRFTGGVRPFFSLEIVSLEGKVHFYIWGRASLRRIVESQLYAQYPGVQIVEAPDYTRAIDPNSKDWNMWATDFKHTAAAPLPIKTYVEYGLDQVQKEPEQVDPLANLIEFMGSIGKGEQIWLQFIIRAHRGERYGTTPGGVTSTRRNKKGKKYTWRDEGEEMVEEIRHATRDTYTDPVTGLERPGFPNPTKGQAEKMAAIERNTSKLAFDVGIRGIYTARPSNFHVPSITHLIALFKPFSTEGWNGLNSSAGMKRFDDYPWEIGVGKKKEFYRRKLVEHYRRRQFFYDPFFEGDVLPGDTAIMSTEELATVFHIPSHSVETPGLERIQSATGEAPPNLPT